MSTPPSGWSRFIVERWLSVDTRTLGLFRIACGLLLLLNLYDRTGGGNLVSFYSNEGILPNHYALFLPPAPGFWSLLLGFSSPWEVRVAFVAVWAVFILYTLGLGTRWMQLLALVMYESVNNRFILIQHGGNVVVNIMLVWSLFLPLGERFSLDALLQSLRRHPGGTPDALNARAWEGDSPRTAVGLAYFGLCFNFAAIYFFNALHKIGLSWLEGSTIHWVLWQNRMATAFAALVRMHEPFWLSPALSWGTLVMEWSLPVLILIPALKVRVKARGLAVAFVWVLHGGIALLCTLGPFSYSMMVTSLVLLQPEHWAHAAAWLAARKLPTVVRYRADVPAQVFWARVASRVDLLRALTFEAGPRFEVVQAGKTLAGGDALHAATRALPLGPLYAWAPRVGLLRALHRAFEGTDLRAPRPPLAPAIARLWSAVKVAAPAAVLVAVISQLMMENWGVHPAIKLRTRPAFMTAIIEYLTIPQGWSMFAPEPPKEDGRLVIDATLSDGSHVDLLSGQPPDFEPWLHAPWGFDQHWGELHIRMRNWKQHWRNFRDYLVRTPQRDGWRADLGIRDFEVFYVSSDCPPRGSTQTSLKEKTRLFGMHDWPL
ncbi:MAG: HTTM domain-containing protein [Archangiaceae bacterium]|nr:HTTM domain-containing protein [Archangiaceae bacterium]